MKLTCQHDVEWGYFDRCSVCLEEHLSDDPATVDELTETFEKLHNSKLYQMMHRGNGFMYEDFEDPLGKDLRHPGAQPRRGTGHPRRAHSLTRRYLTQIESRALEKLREMLEGVSSRPSAAASCL